jgi:hypothetical protein
MTRTCSRDAYGWPALHHRKIPNEPTTPARSFENHRPTPDREEFAMKQYRVLFGCYVRMYADWTIEAEDSETARKLAIEQFKANNDEMDWYDAQFDNIAQPSIVSIQDIETNETVLEGFDFPITAADAREYAADKLLAALQNLMPDIVSEIDQRKHGGNDEDWIELDRKAADARAAIAEATVIKEHQ